MAIVRIGAQPVVEIKNNPGDAEVCRFAGAPLPTGEMTCRPAGTPLDSKSGLWTIFARRPPDLVSLPVVVDGHAPRSLELLPAATLTSARASHELFAYVVRAGTVLPAPLVPADTVVLPLEIHDRTISDIGEPVSVAAGKSAHVLARTGGDYVVAFLERPLNAMAVRDPLEVYSVAGDKRQTPVVEVAPAMTSLLVFRDSNRKAGKVIVTGRGWKTLQQDIPARNGRIAVLPDHFAAARVAKLAIHWWTHQRFEELATGADPDCPHAERNTWNLQRDPAAPFAMALMKCAAAPDDQNVCTEIRAKPLPPGATNGDVVFEDVAPGDYEVRVTYPGLPPLSRRLQVHDAIQTDDDLELRYFTFFGRVTYKRDPVRARLFGTVTDDDGMYRAVLPDELRRTSEFVSPCDGSPTYRMMFEDPPRENARFDIELPGTAIRAVVIDQETRAPLSNALVRYSVKRPGQEAGFGESAGRTGDTGIVTIDHVDKGNEIVVCAAHEHYVRRCSDPFVMKNDERTVELALTKGLALSGRVVAAGPIEGGHVTWYAPDGTLRESVAVMPDGTFTFDKQHQPGEIVIVGSTSQPLYVTRQMLATSDKEVFEIIVPRAPERSLVVVRGANDGGGTKFVSVAVGGVPVPLTPLTMYLMKRVGAQPYLGERSTLSIPSILVTGPIELLVVTGVTTVDPDPFLVPRNVTMTRIPVGDAVEIDVTHR